MNWIDKLNWTMLVLLWGNLLLIKFLLIMSKRIKKLIFFMIFIRAKIKSKILQTALFLKKFFTNLISFLLLTK